MRVFNIFVNITICVTCYGRGALPLYDGRLDSDLNANNFSITNLYSLDVKNVPWVTTNQLDAAIEGVVVAEHDLIAIAQLDAHKLANNPHGVTAAGIGALTAEADPIAYPVATNALALASTALQPGATNGLLRAEADTLATVTARGATTTNEITAHNFIGGRYGFDAGFNASGGSWGAYGYAAGLNASGDAWGAYGFGAGYGANGDAWGAYGNGAGRYASGGYWGAYGLNAGLRANGSEWGAYGLNAGENARGNAWGAYGYGAGYKAVHNNSHAFGYWAGYAARGDSRLYIDVYAANPAYAPDGAINDRIFGDSDGTLYLGRGEGAPGGAVGGVLRGPWTGGGFASAEQVVSGAVCTAESGCRYFWTSATNVVLSVNLTSGQVVNLAKLNNTATNSITAVGQAGWEWTGGDMTNTIAAGKSMTFGFLVDAATGKTNAYATGVSK